MSIVLYLVVMTSAWEYEMGPYPVNMCPEIRDALQKSLDASHAFRAKVVCLPKLVAVPAAETEKIPSY